MLRFNPPVIEDEVLMNLAVEIANNAAALGDKPAVIIGAQVTTWAEFGAMVAQAAGKLVTLGIGRGSFIASLSENSLENIVIFCATLSAGACAVPMPFSATPDALTRMVEDSGTTLLFASDTQMAVAQELGASQVIALSNLANWAADAPTAAPAQVAPQDLFNLIYSSGTTGLPKGIIHDHRFRSRQLSRITRFGLTSEAAMVISTPIYSNTTLFALLPTLMLGATLIVMPKFNTIEFLRLSQELKPTHATLVPVQYMRLLAEPSFDDYDLTSYQMKFCTSAPLPASLIAKIMERWPGNLIEVYGMTEGGVSTALNCRDFPEKWDTVGKPGEGVEMCVIDEQGRKLKSGEFGEIAGRAPSMMPAYHNAQDKTAELLWTDSDGNHFIKSGDMGRIDEDGFVHLMDRKKDMIISGGFNIYAADLESVLRDHPDVTDTAVIAIPSEDWGETPLGFVVLAAGSGTTPEDVCAWANERLGKTQRLSRVDALTTLPRSEIGKVLKKDLRAPYWEN